MTIILIGGTKGGIGKSTLATNIAAILSQKNECLLIDADPQESTTTWAALREEACLSKNLTTVRIKGKEILPQIEKLKMNYRYVIIDPSGRDSITNRAAMIVADIIILPCPPRGPDSWALEDTFALINEVDTLKKGNNKGMSVILLVNKGDAFGRRNTEVEALFDEYIAEYSDVDIVKYPNMIGNRVIFSEAIEKGLAVVEMGRDKKANCEMNDFVSFIDQMKKD